MSPTPWANILQSYYKNATNSSYFVLGATGYKDSTIPYYDRVRKFI